MACRLCVCMYLLIQRTLLIIPAVIIKLQDEREGLEVEGFDSEEFE
jgi:hypothetical protein